MIDDALRRCAVCWLKTTPIPVKCVLRARLAIFNRVILKTTPFLLGMFVISIMPKLPR